MFARACVATVYNAVGLAAYELFDNVDFDTWFKNQLLGELQVGHHRYENALTATPMTMVLSVNIH